VKALKRCPRCKKFKRRSVSFSHSRNGRVSSWCKSCRSDYANVKGMSKYYSLTATPEGRALFNAQRREKWPFYNYGLTRGQIEELKARQNNECAICGFPLTDKYHVDHIHGTDPPVVRGITHPHCNQMLGLAHDNPEVLEKAAIYLRRFTSCNLAEHQVSQERIN
jgi:Recombination endonuclease VII